MDVNTDFSGDETLALVSGVVTAVAAFLPWVTAGVSAGPVEVGASATGIEGLGVFTLVLAVIAVVVVLLLGSEAAGSAAVAIAGLVVAVVGVWKVVDLGGPASPGIGLYLTVVGGLGLLVAGAWGYRARSGSGPGKLQ